MLKLLKHFIQMLNNPLPHDSTCLGRISEIYTCFLSIILSVALKFLIDVVIVVLSSELSDCLFDMSKT